MDNNYEKLFSKIKSLGPPVGLLERIINRIQTERNLLTVKRRLFIFSVGFIGSIAAFVPVFKMVYQGFAESGFMQFLSLLFSDTGVVLSYLGSFLASLLETLPVMGLLAFLAVLLVFLESLKLLSRDIKSIIAPKFVSKQLISH